MQSWRQLAIGNTESGDEMRARAKRFQPLIAERGISRETSVDQENLIQTLVKCRAASRAKSRASLASICGPAAAVSPIDVRKRLGLRPHSQNDITHRLSNESPPSAVKLCASSTAPHPSRFLSFSVSATIRPSAAKRRLLVSVSHTHTRSVAAAVPTATDFSSNSFQFCDVLPECVGAAYSTIVKPPAPLRALSETAADTGADDSCALDLFNLLDQLST